ncbi:WxL domain-containing protein [Lactiplantibacillus daowaiensis]|uniref:WxL domain-containing protein n=1 Tax=Lactiplantibacillus daowaiensis TaxID=2559918 RepID=A0ABW1S1J7_9LACO|nr:WxL domain-containing protein [Lactiplantibacillus daowaiensis]
MSKLGQLVRWLCGFSCLLVSIKMAPLVAQTATQQTQAQIELLPSDGEVVNPVDPNDPSKPYPGDDVDPGNTGTQSRGDLTIDFISNLKFEATNIVNGPVTVTAKNKLAMVQITDRRASAHGWTLQVTPSVPRSGQDTLDTTIELGAVKIKPASTNISQAPQLVSSRLQAGQVNNVLEAKSKAGIGTWLLVLNQGTPATQLMIHDTKLTAGDYQGTLTWQLTDAPS